MAINHHNIHLEYKAFKVVKKLHNIIKGSNKITQVMRNIFGEIAFG
jgi:hypothetical protein